MQHARDPAGAPLPPQQPSSLEDQLRGMIISHQHQQQPRVQTPGAPPIRRIPSQGARQTHPAPIPNTVSYPYPVVAAAPPTIPIPFVPMPQQLQQPHLPRPTRGPGPHDAGTPRFVPKHHPSNKGVVRGGPGSRAPPGGRFPPRSSAPPPPNLDHFPPLGKETPKEKPRPLHSVVPTQHADQPRGQLRQPEVVVGPGFHNSRLFQWRPPQTHYEQFYVEQAFHLDHVAKALLEKITPPDSETSFKEELLRTLQDICKKLCPTAELIPFGSLVTGFATASSDIDCVFSPGPQNGGMTDEAMAGFPAILEARLQEEDFDAKLLSRTRVPIIKMKQRPTPECPQELQCDIGFKNHLAIHNTQLLLCYSKCDVRVKQMVLFVKWWAKRRHINSPYRGTLSSYGYVLMILHYLINIVTPPVLPNLQLQPVPTGTDDGEIHYTEGDNQYNIWFAKDMRGMPPCENSFSLGELLRGFFDYYAYKFAWGQAVISIRTRGGLLTKQEKGWVAAKSRPGNAADGSETWEVKDRYLFALEDPFETAHNVGRTCNGPGVGRIRDELRRAMGLIKIRGDGGKKLGGSLCQEAPAERPFIRKEDREKDPNVPKEKAAEATLAQDPQHLAPIAPAAGNAPAVEPAVTEAAAIPSAVEVTK